MSDSFAGNFPEVVSLLLNRSPSSEEIVPHEATGARAGLSGTRLGKALQFFSWFKPNSFSGRNCYLSTSTGIAPDTGLAWADIENAESTKFDPLAIAEGSLHTLENCFHRHLRFSFGDSGFVDNFINDVEFNQGKASDYRKTHDRIRLSTLSRWFFDDSSSPMPNTLSLNSDLFRRACSKFATGIVVATTYDGRPHGLTVNSFTSVSLDPPLILFCINFSANILPVFQKASHFAINILESDQEAVSSAFAFRGQDRFEGVNWRPGIGMAPVLEGTLATLECKMHSVIEAGDHAIFIGEALTASVGTGEPLLYFDSRYTRLKE